MNESTPSGRPRHPGMFKPGVSGNPSGRTKCDQNLRALAQAHTHEALEILIEVARNKKSPQSARVHAACALLDRGWGKPSQFVEQVNVGGSLKEFLAQVAAEEQANLVRRRAGMMNSIA